MKLMLEYVCPLTYLRWKLEERLYLTEKWGSKRDFQ